MSTKLGFASGLLLTLSACQFSDNNSNSQDALRYGPPAKDKTTVTSPDVARFQAARAVLATNCFECHASWAPLDEAGFRAAIYEETGDPMIKAGDALNSPLYFEMRGASADGDMPKNRPGLSAADLKIIADWIDGMTTTAAAAPIAPAVDPTPSPSPSPTPTPTTVVPPALPPGAQRFSAAQSLLTSRCISCHAHSSWAPLDEAGYVATQADEGPLVVPGSPATSAIYTRLKGINPNGNMPKGRAAPAFTEAEAQVLRDWIANIGQP